MRPIFKGQVSPVSTRKQSFPSEFITYACRFGQEAVTLIKTHVTSLDRHGHPAPYQNLFMFCVAEPRCLHLYHPARRVGSTLGKLPGKARHCLHTTQKSVSSICWSPVWLLPLSQALNDLIYFGSPFFSCWSLICYVCSKTESLLDLLLPCEPRWYSAGSRDFAVVAHRKLSSEQVPACVSHRQLCSPGLLALSSQGPSADGDQLLALLSCILQNRTTDWCFSFSLEVLLSKFSWCHLHCDLAETRWHWHWGLLLGPFLKIFSQLPWT